MAASIVTDSEFLTPMNSFHVVFTRFNYATSGDTVSVPTGCVAAAVLVSGTAPTTSIAAGATADLVTISAGTTGTGVLLVTRHGGNIAAVR